MSIKEANRLSVMRQVDKKVLSLRKASEELGLTERQTKRVRKRYLAEGEKGLISKHRGKISPNRMDPELRAQVIEILQREDYRGFGPLFATEKLRTLHGYYLSDETIRKWMIQEGLWKTKAQKIRKIYQRRERRDRFGELLQGDGSRHAWFEERGKECTLVIFVDDATSQITAGKFTEAETTNAYQEILEQHLMKYGKPLGLYVDKHAIFRTSRNNVSIKETETHFGRILRELDIDLICAHSPQAKGRVERANGTLQDRLIKEMRLKRISNIEEGNRFLDEFIKEYNKRFGKEPKSQEDAHRSMRKEDDLEKIFAHRCIRKLSKNLSFQYQKKGYQLQLKEPNRFRKTYVHIIERPGKPIIIVSEGEELAYTEWEEDYCGKPKVLSRKELEAYWSQQERKKPSKHHPWR